MVFYTCSGCGESLKKNKVEKHCYSCRSCEYLTCMDCSKDFYGNDYKAHTSCISEEQKYSAVGFKAKPNKGEVKQQEWLKTIRMSTESYDGASPKAKELLESMQDYSNIPRKRGKFFNFLKNSLRIYDTQVSEELWAIFSANKNVVKKEKDGTEVNKIVEESAIRKRKLNNFENVDNIPAKKIELDGVKNQGKFPWNSTVKKCLKATSDHEMPIKKLRKKVIAEYHLFGDHKISRTDNEIKALFLKKINKNPKLLVRKEIVKLK